MKRLLVAGLLVLTHWANAAAQPPGMTRFNVSAPHQKKAIESAIWYPTKEQSEVKRYAENPVFVGIDVIMDAKPDDNKYPVVLLSHGMGGGVQPMTWLGAGLAKRGAIVIAVAHQGSTFSDFDPDRLFDHWTRVQDLQAVYAHVERMPRFKDHIDPQQLYVAGFSYGGWTALSMAGATGNLAGYIKHCETVGDDGPGCDLFKEKNIALSSFDAERWDASYTDSRVKAAVAIDPGLIYGLESENVKDLVGNITLVGLGEGKDRLPAADYRPGGSNFIALVPKATVVEIAPATHFTALPVCQPEGAAILLEEKDDPVCTDPEGTDRAGVHMRIIEAVAEALGLDAKREERSGLRLIDEMVVVEAIKILRITTEFGIFRPSTAGA